MNKKKLFLMCIVLFFMIFLFVSSLILLLHSFESTALIACKNSSDNFVGEIKLDNIIFDDNIKLYKPIIATGAVYMVFDKECDYINYDDWRFR